MPRIERIGIALLAFGFAGLGVIVWQPEGWATTPRDRPAYFLAISAGTGLKLANSAARLPAQPALSCERVFSLGEIAIGTRCVSDDRAVSARR